LSEGGDFVQRWKLAQGPTATREVLCDAAQEMIHADGLDALNMRRLAAKVGVSAMAPYKYYRGKETLIEEVRSRVRRDFGQRLKAAADAASSPTEKLRRLCSAYLQYAIDNERDYRLISAPNGSAQSVFPGQPAHTQAWRVLQNVVHNLPGRDPEIDPLDQAHLVWASLHGLVDLHLTNRLSSGRSVQELGSSAVPFLLNALLVS
jgi:AcrR family transcriptional regulator